MKNILLTTTMLLLMNIFTFAGGDWATSAVSLTKDNGTAYNFKLNDENWTDGDWQANTAFDAYYFGIPTSLILNGASGNGWTDDSPGYTSTSFILYYRAYLTSGTAGTWNQIALDNPAYKSGNNSIYDKSGAAVDILALVGNTTGNYTLEIVMSKNQYYTGGNWNSMIPGGQVIAYNSSTAGYKATFKIESISAPTIQASAIVFSSVQTTQMTIGWTNGNGAKRAVFVKEGSGAITNPTDNTTYTASANWASKGTQLGSSGYYCVYNNNSNTVTLTGLSSATQYTVQIFEYNGPALGEKYNVTTATNNPKSQTSNSLIKYVDASKADDSGDGFTWASAKKTLQAAIDLSVSGDQIWVKEGTYYPTFEAGGTGERYKAFQMKDGVAIYGGFDLTSPESTIPVRAIKDNPTILSGDIGIPGDNTDNSYNVFYLSLSLALTNSAVLDGFVIQDGNANDAVKGGGLGTVGGGIYLIGNAPLFQNCIIQNNYASAGGGVAVTSFASPVFTNCVVANNTGTDGSGFVVVQADLTLNNTTIAYNQANASSGNGGGIYSIMAHLYINNSIVWGNTAAVGNQFSFLGTTGKNGYLFNLNNSCFANGINDVYDPSLYKAENSCNYSDPKFVNAATADFSIFGTSSCLDLGNDSYCTLNTDIRGAGFGRKLSKVDGTAGTIDIGAYEYKFGTDPASSCENAITVTNNNSSGAGSLQQALLDICEDGTITLSLAVNWPANLTLSKNFTLDLHGFSVSNTGNYTALIDVGKAVGIKNTSSKYLFNVKIAFAATTSTLALYSEDVLGSGFSVSATSTASGLLQIGDGTTAITHTYTTSDPKFNSKISKILVKYNSNLILNPPFDKK